MKCSILIAFLVFSLCIALSTQASLRKPGSRRNIVEMLRRNPNNIRPKRMNTFPFPITTQGGLGGNEVIVALPIGPNGGNQGWTGGANPGGYNQGGLNLGGYNQGGYNGQSEVITIPINANGQFGPNQGFPGGVRPGGVRPGGNGGGIPYPVGGNGGVVPYPVGNNGGIPIGVNGGVVNPGGPNIPYNGDDDCPFPLYLFGLCDSEEDDGDDSGDHDHDDDKK